QTVEVDLTPELLLWQQQNAREDQGHYDVARVAKEPEGADECASAGKPSHVAGDDLGDPVIHTSAEAPERGQRDPQRDVLRAVRDPEETERGYDAHHRAGQCETPAAEEVARPTRVCIVRRSKHAQPSTAASEIE